MQSLSLRAVLTKITSTADGGWRVTFDLDQSEMNAIQELILLKDSYLELELKFANEKS